MRRRRAIVILCTAQAAAPVAHAYRPFEGTDADVAEIGELELEVGPLQASWAHGHATFVPSGVYNQGIAPGYELVVDVDGLVPLGAAPGDALLASDVLVKHVLRAGSLQDRSGPSVALETGVLLPDAPARGSEAGWVASLIASQRFDAFTVHLNASGSVRARAFAGFASAIVEGPGAWPVRPVGELLVARDADGGRAGSALVGAIWRAGKDLAIDTAIVGEREQGSTTVELRLGFTWAMEI
ncbi:MAG TPA: hypothetical protein VFP84_13380 [Kofleriaceae bacterium]|nr:hypothetical protein [Kofleriaceae bacterium]